MNGLNEDGYIKDIDCTRQTPIWYGEPDSPIYGKGIRIKPRIPGRRDSRHMEGIYLPELLPLEDYDLVIVLLSGGKDSIACYYKLLELGVPKKKIELWHHDSTTRSCIKGRRSSFAELAVRGAK